MTDYKYHLIDNNTGEEVYASNDFRFQDVPQPGHVLHDPDLQDHFGTQAVVDHVEENQAHDGPVEVRVYIDSNGEQLNDDNVDADQSYRRS